jgi:hypothetical protein
MSRSGRVISALQLAIVLVSLAIFARLLVPFSADDNRVLTPPGRYLDAALATFLIADGVDKLHGNPRGFYDTAILYPDRTQLRSTEPFLGFALAGLPLRSLLRLGDVDTFETLRWLMLFTALVYAYLLFRAAGLDVGLAAAGAAICLSQSNLLVEIARLQVLSIPLILPVLYHAVMIRAGRLHAAAHSVALFVWLALYPLMGMINATVGIAAALFLLPLLLQTCVELKRQGRLPALIVPVVAAVVLDVVVLAPWLFDREDLRMYAADAFLAVKNWRPAVVPLRAGHIVSSIDMLAGLGLAVALTLMVGLSLTRRGRGAAGVSTNEPSDASTVPRSIWVIPAMCLAMALAASYGVNRHDVAWPGVLFDLGCAAVLLAYWRGQIRVRSADGPKDIAGLLTFTSGGLSVLLCLVSFGPVYGGNRHPLASRLTNVLVEIIPPMKSIREFDRVWIFGILFLSIYVIVRIGQGLRTRGTLVRAIVAAILAAAALGAVAHRPLAPSPTIEAPRAFVESVAQSPGRGGIYVHPYMQWNSPSGVLMIAIARELKRPIVNGYLGIILPWFVYASDVLGRYPDPEALWLLRKWKVETVVSLLGGVPLENLTSPVPRSFIAITELPAAPDVLHPSERHPEAAGAHERIDAPWTPRGREGVNVVAVKTPAGFSVAQVEVQFQSTAVARVPANIDIFGIDAASRVRLNEGQSGQWLESLAADALVRREAPVAAIRLVHPAQGDLELECRGSADPPIERIVLIGNRLR